MRRKRELENAKKEQRDPVIGPLTESDAWMKTFEENIEVEIVGTLKGPEFEDYLAELAIQLWLARPNPDKGSEGTAEAPERMPPVDEASQRDQGKQD